MKSVTMWCVLLALLLAACGEGERSEVGVLVGTVTMEDVYRTCPGFRRTSEQYDPNEDIVQKLRVLDRRITFVVFLGTWCSDSEEHVPPFERLMTAVSNPNFRVEYYGVDRQKNDGLGLAERFGITYVPTFILFEEGREIGRIVERPTVSIGVDVLDIIEGKE